MSNLEKKEVLQAVVIVDNFNDNFVPITNEIPVVSLDFHVFITSFFPIYSDAITF